VVKFSRQGQIKWILGPHENWGPAFQKYLLTPVGTPFEWQYGQHAPIITPQGTVLLYDNGNLRAEPFQPTVPDVDNHSRAVEYSIDETKMEVTQVWDYGRTNADRLYTDRVGSAYWLPKRENVLITFGFAIEMERTAMQSYAPVR
jgi:arylsulfate sulfotransferase